MLPNGWIERETIFVLGLVFVGNMSKITKFKNTKKRIIGANVQEQIIFCTMKRLFEKIIPNRIQCLTVEGIRFVHTL